MGRLRRMLPDCRSCEFHKTCNEKLMVGELERPLVATSSAEATADLTAPLAVKHDYRDVKIGENTTVTIDVEDLKKQLQRNIEKELFPERFFLYGG